MITSELISETSFEQTGVPLSGRLNMVASKSFASKPYNPLKLRVFQALSCSVATVAFGFGGDRWTTKDTFIDAPEYNRSIRTWGEHRVGGMYIALGLSMILVISTAISVYFCARGKPQKLRPQCPGAFWCLYLGVFTTWFSVHYSPVPQGYSQAWVVSASFFFFSCILYVSDMVYELRSENEAKAI